MKQSFVLDVSACLPWCCEDETTPASEQTLEWAVQGSALHVPALWLWEIVNVLGVAVKRRRISAGRSQEFPVRLGTFNFHVAAVASVTGLPQLQALASRHKLTAYDAAYLELALRFSLPLATRDDDLRKAARAEAVEVLNA